MAPQWTAVPNSLLEQGHPTAHGTGLHPVRETPYPLTGQSVPVLSKEVLPHSGGIPCGSFSIYCLLSYCSAPPRIAWLHPFYPPASDMLLNSPNPDTCILGVQLRIPLV